MGDTQLNQTSLEKVLGIHVDHQLEFREQAAAATSKASRIGILAVICQSFALLDESSLPLMFRAMVRPYLEYANSILGPFNWEDQRRIEKVQRRATKLVATIRNQPYEERLRILDMPSLYHRCRRGDMITVYQVLRQGIDLEAERFFAAAPTGNTRGHQWKLTKPRAVSRVRRNASSSESSTIGTHCRQQSSTPPA